MDQGDYCNFFQRPFNGSLYSYTADGFVSKIDFMDSGIRGLTFNVAFDTDGPGTTGDLLERRKSIEDENATSSAAEHKIFLSPPDLTCFPDGECGEIIDVTLSCNADDFCLNFNISQPGDVQFVLDANDNGTFDLGSQDVIFLESFDTAGDKCISWDGLLGDGSAFMNGETIKAIIQFTQGVQHYAAYDVEYLEQGYCVETVRPAGCATDNKLYWDDSNLTTLPGTGQPLSNVTGCICRTDGCRTWDNFLACGGANNNDPGYGNFNTLNTWWFAFVDEVGDISLSLPACSISAESSYCEGETINLEPEISGGPVVSYEWEAPDGTMSTDPSLEILDAVVADGGTYTLTIINDGGCTSTCEVEIVVTTSPTCELTNIIPASGSTNSDGSFDLTISGGTPAYDYTVQNGTDVVVQMGNFNTNGGMVTIGNLPPDSYVINIMDANGCTTSCLAVLEVSAVEIEKTISNSAAPTGLPNEYTITYNIDIINAGTISANYDLTDTLKFGLGTTINEVVVSYVGGGTESLEGTSNISNFDGQVDYLIVDDEMIAPGSTEAWEVIVTFMTDPITVTTQSGDCTLETSETGTGLLNCAVVSGGVESMSSDVCEPIPMPMILLDKTISTSATPTGAQNEFSIIYNITVENTGTVPAFFDLSDTLKYGLGTTVETVSVNYLGGGTETVTGIDNSLAFDGQASYLIVENEMIAAGATESWEVEVVFTIEPTTITMMSADCIVDTGETGTGLLNCAAVGGGVPEMVVDECEPIPMPMVSLEKTITSSAVETGNPNEFSIVYAISVQNTGAALAFYDLSDTLKYGLGATVVSTDVSYLGGGTETLSGLDLSSSFDGETNLLITEGEMIAIGAVESWSVEIVFTIDPSVTTMMSGDCTLETSETGTGLLNCAAVGGGVPSVVADACEPIPMPMVELVKTISQGQTSTGNPNEFTVIYNLSIENTGDIIAFYSLADTLLFGNGINVSNASASYVGGGTETQSGVDFTGSYDGLEQYLIAKDEMIAVGETEEWEIIVTFILDLGVISDTDTDCNLDTGESGTGLLNIATVSGLIPEEEDDICNAVLLPEVILEKEVSVDPIPTGGINEFVIEYLITTENIGDVIGFYDLTDTLKFGLGTEIISIQATYLGGVGESLTGDDNSTDFDGASDYTIVENEMLLPGNSEEWLITVVFVVDPSLLSEASVDCSLESSEEGTGLLNCATIGGASLVVTDEACAETPFPMISLEKIISSTSSPTGDANEYSITYDITIINTGTVIAFYDLSDTLKFGLGAALRSVEAIYNASGTETLSGTDLSATFNGRNNHGLTENEMIDVGQTESWSITAVYEIFPNNLTDTSGDCELLTTESGTGLLNCAAVGGPIAMMTDEACEEIPLPEVSIIKEVLSEPVATGESGEYKLDYLVTVTNIGNIIAYYDLTDSLKFGNGIVVSTLTVSYVGISAEVFDGIQQIYLQ